MFEYIKLPWWISGKELTKLKNAAIEWFKRIAQWAKWPLEQIDPLTCDRGILELIAWQRDITRYDGEPLDLYRKRVAYAFVNARDAGSTIGFINICERLDIGHISTEERIQGIDWDIVNIHLNDEQLADNPELLKTIIRQYGRTCRRYNFLLETPVLAYMRCGEVANSFATVVALLPPTRSVTQSQIHELGLNRKTLAAGLPILPPEPPEPDQAIGYGKGHEVVYSRLTASAGLPLKPPPFPEPVSMTAFAKGDEQVLSRKTVSAVLPINPPPEPEPFEITFSLRGGEKALTFATVVALLKPSSIVTRSQIHELGLDRSTLSAELPILPPEPPEPNKAVGYGKGHEIVYSILTTSAGLPLTQPPLPKPVCMTAFARGDELSISRKTVVSSLPLPELEPPVPPFLVQWKLLAHEVTLNRITVTASLTELYIKLKTRNFSVASNNSTFVASLAV